MAVEGAQPNRKLAKEIENEMGEDYFMDMRHHWDLRNKDEKHDIIPEIFLGKNVADFIDPDIMKVRFGLLIVLIAYEHAPRWRKNAKKKIDQTMRAKQSLGKAKRAERSLCSARSAGRIFFFFFFWRFSPIAEPVYRLL